MEKRIFDYCWGILQSYKDKELSLTCSKQSKSLGWIEPDNITETEAKSLLASWIHQSLLNHGAVYLYSCGDNAHISIEDPPSADEKEYLDTIIENTFYHADD